MDNYKKIYFKNTMRAFYYRSFELGKLYFLYTHKNGKIVKFIKVTRKGFNLLDIATNKCVLKQHIYSRDLCNKDIPENMTVFKNVLLPDSIYLNELKQENINETKTK